MLRRLGYRAFGLFFAAGLGGGFGVAYIFIKAARVAGNIPLSKNFKPQPTGEVKCQTWLGGLLKHYYRDSA